MNFSILKANLINKIPGQIYLWIAVVILGSSGAVTRKITEIGAENFMDGENPVSLCNVLFVGNACALLVLLAIYWRELNLPLLKSFSGKKWFFLLLVAILSGAIAPGLFFDALGRTEVNNVILIGRIQPVIVLTLSTWLLKERVNHWQVSGAVVSLVGVAVTIFWQILWDDMLNPQTFSSLGLGEIFTALAACVSALGIIFTKKQLTDVSLGISSITRTTVGTIVFFFAATILYGSDHFMEVFSPFLWKWMVVYGILIVVLGQSAWLTGLKHTSAAMASLASSFSPIAGILAAFFVLGEAPTSAQYVGGSIILAGIFCSQIGLQRQLRGSESMMGEDAATEIEDVGYKGI